MNYSLHSIFLEKHFIKKHYSILVAATLAVSECHITFSEFMTGNITFKNNKCYSRGYC